MEFIELEMSSSKFVYDMYYDHDVISGEFGNLVIYDLTNYPKTRTCFSEPSSRRQLVGLRQGEEASILTFTTTMYTEECPRHAPNTLLDLDVDIAMVSIVFEYELIFRVIDYFFDKILWALSDSDPYIDYRQIEEGSQRSVA